MASPACQLASEAISQSRGLIQLSKIGSWTSARPSDDPVYCQKCVSGWSVWTVGLFGGGEATWIDMLVLITVLAAALLIRTNFTQAPMKAPDTCQLQKIQPQRTRILHLDVARFLCMWAVTLEHMGGSALWFPLCHTYFLTGFAFLSGLHAGDGGRVLMSAAALQSCLNLLTGSVLFNLIYFLAFACGAQMCDMFLVFPSEPDARRPSANWFIYALVLWKIVVTPTANLVRSVSVDSKVVCVTLALALVYLRYFCADLPWPHVYTRVLFHAPFFALGLEGHSLLESARVKALSLVIAGLVLGAWLVESSHTHPHQELSWLHAVWLNASAGQDERLTLLGGVVQFVSSSAIVFSLVFLCELICRSLPGPLCDTMVYWGQNSLNAYFMQKFIPIFRVQEFKLLCDVRLAAMLPCPMLLVQGIFKPCVALGITAFYSSRLVDWVIGSITRPQWLTGRLRRTLAEKPP